MRNQQFIIDTFGFELLGDLNGNYFEKQINENTWMTLSGCPDSKKGMAHVVGSDASDVRLEINDDGGRTLESWILSEELGVFEHDIATEIMVKIFLLRYSC